MTYDEAITWLDSLESLGIRPGLERITALLDRLGNPQRDFPSVLVAGTNGKGSVVAFLASILRQAGWEAGVYTSPHLVRFEERIRIGSDPIPPADLAALTREVRGAVAAHRNSGGAPPTYFEATTALAFLHFSRRRVPIAVLEVGMGGRYDATNVVTPLACAITSVSLDHTRWLGQTVAEIAHQKAGILKAGVPAAVSAQEAAAREVIRGEAARAGAPLIETAACEVRGAASDPPRFSLRTPAGGNYPDLAPSLRGDHQVENATLAVLLAEVLRRGGFSGIDPGSVSRGLGAAVWPGRLDLIPALGEGTGPDLLLDGAHNPAGCAILAAYLSRYQARRPRRALLFAAMRDKPAAEMLGILKPVFDAAVVTSLPVARGAPPADLLRIASEAGLTATCEPDLARSFDRASGLAGPGGLLVASGSLYLVGEVMKRLGRDPAVRRGA
jgi:dihydrofolate synthase/folylpolyglutamate synthase